LRAAQSPITLPAARLSEQLLSQDRDRFGAAHCIGVDVERQLRFGDSVEPLKGGLADRAVVAIEAVEQESGVGSQSPGFARWELRVLDQRPIDQHILLGREARAIHVDHHGSAVVAQAVQLPQGIIADAIVFVVELWKQVLHLFGDLRIRGPQVGEDLPGDHRLGGEDRLLAHFAQERPQVLIGFVRVLAEEGEEVRRFKVQLGWGRARDLGPVWFVGNAELVSFATGPIGIVLGLNFAWTAVAIVLGTLLGCLLMAFHSAQGPKLGLSQMIQSRAQFGYFGALFPIAVALFIFIGYSVFDTFLGGQLLNETIRTPLKFSYVLFAVLALGITVVGYNLIHRASRWASVLYVLNFGLFTIIALWKIRLPHEQFALTSGT